MKKLHIIEALESRIAPANAASISIGALTGALGFHVNGLGAGDQAGVSVHSAGDVNNDGYGDIVVGVSGSNATAGGAYVIFGAPGGTPASFDPNTLNGTNGFRITGVKAGDFAGSAVGGAGDINGDGYDDVVIGAGDATANNVTKSGEAYVVFGRSTGPANVNLANLTGTDGFRLQAFNSNTFLGGSVAGAGDVNHDGFDDVIVGASNGNGGTGYATVVYGHDGSFLPVLNAAAIQPGSGFRLLGGSVNDGAGFSVAGAGDVNGDGIADLLVGAPNAGNGGEAYLVYGKAGPGGVVQLGSLAAGEGVRFIGLGNSFAGSSLAGIGDFNGDGFGDIAIGADMASNGALVDAGKTAVVYGKANLNSNIALVALVGSSGFTLNGSDANALSGYAVGGAGDVNGDGYSDLIVGAPSAKVGNSVNGRSFVVYGAPQQSSSSLDLNTVADGIHGYSIDGNGVGQFSGGGVSSAGDFNGDGFADVLVGSFGVDLAGKMNAGSAGVVFGNNGDNHVTISTNGHVATYTDADGDLVTIKTSKGTFKPEQFTLSGQNEHGGSTLRLMDISNAADFAKANITISAKPQKTSGVSHGDGLVNVGAFEADNLALGTVRIAGDVGHLNIGDGTNAAKLVVVNSVGAAGLSTQGGHGATSLTQFDGAVGILSVRTGVHDSSIRGTTFGAVGVGGDFEHSTFSVFGTVNPKNQAASVALKSFTVNGDFDHSNLLGGFGILNSNADVSFGKILVKGDYLGSLIDTGVRAGNDGLIGTADDVAMAGGKADVFARIASVVIRGQAAGSYAPGGHYAITAQKIGALTIGTTKMALQANALDTHLALGATGDLFLNEV